MYPVAQFIIVNLKKQNLSMNITVFVAIIFIAHAYNTCEVWTCEVLRFFLVAIHFDLSKYFTLFIKCLIR